MYGTVQRFDMERSFPEDGSRALANNEKDRREHVLLLITLLQCVDNEYKRYRSSLLFMT